MTLILWLGRKRVPNAIACGIIAAVFALTSGFNLCRMEWFDVWRHGIPPLSLLAIYAVYMAVFGSIGWFIARGMFRRRDMTFGE